MDKNLLLPRENYAEKAKDMPRPYCFEISKQGQFLFFFGANHSHNPENDQYPKLLEYWNKFLEETKKKNLVVLVEGQLRRLREGATMDEIIQRHSEGGFITFLANKEKVPVICPEPDKKMILKKLLDNFSKEEVVLYRFLQLADSRSRTNPRPDFIEFIDNRMNYYEEQFWPDFDFSFKHMMEIFRKYFNQDFNEGETRFINNATNPNKTEFITNKVARTSSDIRDLEIASQIENIWNQGKNIFVVFGSGHAIIEEPALKQVLS